MGKLIGDADQICGYGFSSTYLGNKATHISNHASFDQRNYGFKKLSDLFMAIDLFEMKKTNGSVLWVRDKKKAKLLNKPN